MTLIRSLRLCGFAVLLSAVLAGCSTLPAPVVSESFAVPADPASGLGLLARAGIAPGASSAVRPLAQASYSLDARLSLIGHATRTLDLQYYLVQDDDIGRTVLHALRDAATRGVRVRLLVDDLYTATSGGLLHDLNGHANVEVRLFNPFPGNRSSLLGRFAASLFDFDRVNHRMHNKLFIADGAFAIAGGRNLGDEYFRRSRLANFLDFDVLLAGDVVPELAGVFDRFWNSPLSYPLATFEPPAPDSAPTRSGLDGLRPQASSAVQPLPSGSTDLHGHPALGEELSAGRPPERLSEARVHVFSDPPDKVSAGGRTAGSVTASYLETVKSARRRVILVSPYFVPGEVGLAALREARARGVHVTVVTNARDASDEPFVAAAYARYREQLLGLDVELYEASAHRMRQDGTFNDPLGLGLARSHAKLTVIDDRAVFVGSMNADLRSARLNTELGLLIESPELAEQSARLVDRVCERGCYRVRLSPHGLQWLANDGDGREVVLDSEPAIDRWTRIKLLLLGPLVPDGLL